MSTTATPARLLLALLLLAVGACAPRQEWVNPSVSLSQRSGDMHDCQTEAAWRERRQNAYQRDRIAWDAYRARTPSDRAFANMRMHQLDTLATMDRNRFFEHCMSERGYRLRDVD
ncbi:MAG: hypothetical protein FJX57_03045 [Alphaproteobacteria bacterium]|nr:hypothetical protein [Alphaproteobacteria bacterium]